MDIPVASLLLRFSMRSFECHSITFLLCFLLAFFPFSYIIKQSRSKDAFFGHNFSVNLEEPFDKLTYFNGVLSEDSSCSCSDCDIFKMK